MHQNISKRVLEVSNYFISNNSTVRATAKALGLSKTTVHTDVTLQNGLKNRHVIPESIKIKKVFLAEKNPVVRLGLVIR